MLRLIDDAPALDANDPFVHAAPCWQVRVYWTLPPEVMKLTVTELEEHTTMPLRIVTETDAPVRLKGGNGPASSSDYHEVLTAMKTLPPGKALVVTLGDQRFTKNDAKQPEVKFASALRRYFQDNGLSATAYQSGKLEVTVRRAAEPPKARKRK